MLVQKQELHQRTHFVVCPEGPIAVQIEPAIMLELLH